MKFGQKIAGLRREQRPRSGRRLQFAIECHRIAFGFEETPRYEHRRSCWKNEK